jgi:hypothetical protein
MVHSIITEKSNELEERSELERGLRDGLEDE